MFSSHSDVKQIELGSDDIQKKAPSSPDTYCPPPKPDTKITFERPCFQPWQFIMKELTSGKSDHR